MSRSTTKQEGSSHPCQVWYEWSGKNGNLKNYDKATESNIETKAPFKFMLLDIFSVIKGWSEINSSGIYSNETKTTGKTPFVVRAYKGGTLVEGLYKDIKDKIKAVGGTYNKNLYISTIIDGETKICSLVLKGASLSAWVTFSDENKGELYNKAIVISGSVTGKKGAVTFQTPNFELVEATEAEKEVANGLDVILQQYLNSKEVETPGVIENTDMPVNQLDDLGEF